MNKYYLPTEIYFDLDSLDHLPNIISPQDKRVYLVLGAHILKDGIFDDIKKSMPARIDLEVFGEPISNPTVEDVEKVVGIVKDFNPDVVISIGGGSILDIGKSAAILLRNDGKLIDFITGKEKLKNAGIRFVAVPTTAGTGSEVTPWATIWGEDNKKYSLSSSMMFPSVALCDPKLTLSMPPYLTACTGMDALSQAIEAYWSIHSTCMSDTHALEAIKAAINSLEVAVGEPNNLTARKQMMHAALEAGLAFSQTATTAVHSVSYPMTSLFNIPHGHACALTLASFLKYNYGVEEFDCNDERGVQFAKNKIMQIVYVLGCESIDEACEKLTSLMHSIGLETSLSKVGVSDLEVVIEHGFTPNRVANNPRLVTEQNLRELLREIY